MFFVEENNKIILFDEDRAKLEDTLRVLPQHEGLEIQEVPEGYKIVDYELLTEEEAAQKEEQKEHERIMELFMTRSDFFDNTIKAWGADSEDLLIVIGNTLESLHISDIEKKIAINNYKNALNFYRKHTLFTLLSGVPITIGEVTIVMTQGQWDSFFDEVNKGNQYAYTKLLPDLES